MVLSVVVFADEADGAGLVWRAVSKLNSLISDLGDVAGGCTNGQIMEYQTSNSTWICGTDDTGGSSGFTNIASAPATGAKLIQDNSTVSTSVTLKTLTAGTGISLTNNTSDVVIINTVTDTTGITSIASGVATANNATLIADNSTVANKVTLKTLSQGNGIHLTNNTNSVLINSTVPIMKPSLGNNVTTVSNTTWEIIWTIPLKAGSNFISIFLSAYSDQAGNAVRFHTNTTSGGTNSKGQCSWLVPTALTTQNFDLLNASGHSNFQSHLGTGDTAWFNPNATAVTANCAVFSTASDNLNVLFKSEGAGRTVAINNGSFYINSSP